MNNSSIVSIVNLFLGVISFAMAGNGSAAVSQGVTSTFKYAELNRIGDATTVLKVKEGSFAQIIPLVASGALKGCVDSRFSAADIKQAVTRAAQRVFCELTLDQFFVNMR